MKIFDTRTPRVLAVAALGVLTLTQNAQGTPDPLVITSTGGTMAVDIPVAGAKNVLTTGWSTWNATPNTVALASVIATDTLTIQGQVFTAVASGASGKEFNVGLTDAATATNLAAVITSWFAKNEGPWFQVNDPFLVFEALAADPMNAEAVTATVSIEVSVDGVNAVTHPDVSAFSLSGTGKAVGVSKPVGAYPFVRANVSAMSGTGAYAQVMMHGTAVRA